MPINERVFNRAVNADNAAELLNRFEKLRRELRSRANTQQLRRAYNGEPANFGLKLGGMEKLQDLKALGELLGIEDPFEIDDPTRRRDVILSLQTNEEVRVRIAEVGAPDEVSQQISDFIADSIEDAAGAFDGFTTPGVARSLSLFMREYMAENQLLTVEEVSEDPNFAAASSNFVSMVEWRERIAESNRILDAAAQGDTTELQNIVDLRQLPSLGDAAQFLQQDIEQLQGQVNQVLSANPNGLVTRIYETSVSNDWLTGNVTEVNDAQFSLISDSEWQLFLTNEAFTPAVRDFFNNNRGYVEEQFGARPDKGTSFLVWSGGEFAAEAQDVVDRFGPVSFGFHMDSTLDPLINEVVGQLPVEIRQAARDRMKEFIATIQIGPNQDKGKLWVEFQNGQHGQTPDGVLNRYLGDVIAGRPGGSEFVEAARSAGINLVELAGDSGDPQEWLESITTNGASRGLPPVQVVQAEDLNLRAWVIEQFAGDPDMENAPAVVRNAIYGSATEQIAQLGLEPLTTANRLDYSQVLNNVIGVTAIKANTLESIVRASGPEGDQLWEDLKRQQQATGVFAPDSILEVFNELPVDKDTLLIDNLNVQLEEAAQNLGPTPEEAALAGFADLTRNLPTAIQGVANRRIQSFLDTFIGEQPEDVLARQDVQDRVALIIEGVGAEFIGSDEVVELAVSAFGGLNQFFEAFPDLQESDIGTIQEFIVDNFDTIIESAGEDAEVAELTRARQRVLTERRTEELRQRRQVLQNEAEERALEFDESEQGRELARLQQDEQVRQEQLAVFNPELERAVRQRIAGPAASQVLQDVGPQLQREFLARQEGIQLAGGDVTLTPQDFLGELDADFFQQQRRLSNIRRTPVNIAAPQAISLNRTQQSGPGFSSLRRGI